jgi:hypothetical protein
MPWTINRRTRRMTAGSYEASFYLRDDRRYVVISANSVADGIGAEMMSSIAASAQRALDRSRAISLARRR